MPQSECNIRSIKNEKEIGKEPFGITIPNFETADEPDAQLRKQSLERFESEVSDSEKDRIIQTFAQEAFPHGFLPPTKVVRSMAAAKWFGKYLIPFEPAVRAAD